MTPFLADPPSRRIVVLAAVAGAVLPTILTWNYFVALSGCSTAVQLMADALSKGAAVRPAAGVAVGVLPPRAAGAAVRGEGRGRGARLRRRRRGGDAFGVLLLAGAGRAARRGRQSSCREGPGLGIGGPLSFVAWGCVISAVNSLLEEWYWRWFVFGAMRRLMPAAAAIVLSGLAFAAHHVVVLGCYFGWTSPATAAFSLAVAVGGAVWAWMYDRHGSLLGPWLSHILVDAAIFAVGFSLIHAAWQ